MCDGYGNLRRGPLVLLLASGISLAFAYREQSAVLLARWGFAEVQVMGGGMTAWLEPRRSSVIHPHRSDSRGRRPAQPRG